VPFGNAPAINSTNNPPATAEIVGFHRFIETPFVAKSPEVRQLPALLPNRPDWSPGASRIKQRFRVA
jgi:hypothetical protein